MFEVRAERRAVWIEWVVQAVYAAGQAETILCRQEAVDNG